MEGGNPLLSPQTGTIIWTLVTFIALLIGLRIFAWKPILGLLEEREKTIRDSLDSARKAREEAEAHLQESREALRKARQEMASVIEKGQKEAEKIRAELMDKAHKDAEATRHRGLEEIEREKRAAIAEIRASAADLAVAAAGRIVASSMDESAQRRIVSEFLEEMEKGSHRS
ncbi:MAG TPA: F0F1 ATP synthase subunit B [Candidatus Saccharimonadales bacterium]|nr:F0F1 ATP synthase subunit B [Candidatus Saccharimonadales bacterium]